MRPDMRENSAFATYFLCFLLLLFGLRASKLLPQTCEQPKILSGKSRWCTLGHKSLAPNFGWRPKMGFQLRSCIAKRLFLWNRGHLGLRILFKRSCFLMLRATFCFFKNEIFPAVLKKGDWFFLRCCRQNVFLGRHRSYKWSARFKLDTTWKTRKETRDCGENALLEPRNSLLLLSDHWVLRVKKILAPAPRTISLQGRLLARWCDQRPFLGDNFWRPPPKDLGLRRK